MPAYRFGEFLLDSARRELLHDGAPVDLPPKAFDLIVYLIVHRDRAVGRDEIIAGVWGRVDVSDNVLDQIVLRARRALGDAGEPRRFIATRPRFGFAWVAPVSSGVPDPGPDPGHVPEPEPEPQARIAIEMPPVPRHGLWIALGAAVLMVAAVTGWQWRGMSREAAPVSTTGEAERGTVAVLPFDIVAGADSAWTRLGLMDAVAHRLRDAGIETLPSDNVVALLRGVVLAGDDDEAALALAQRVGQLRVVRGKVTQTNGTWRVVLRMAGPQTKEWVGEALQPIDAAVVAADQLLLSLGAAAGSESLPRDEALTLRLQQIDAAVLGDAMDAAQQLLDDVPPDQRNQPGVRLRAATLRFRVGDLDVAADAFEALLDDVSAQDDPLLRGSVLSALANVAVRRGDAGAAQPYVDEAVKLLASQPLSNELGRALVGRATTHSMQGRFDAALEDYSRARVVFESVGDRLGTARVDNEIGILDARRDRYAEAEPRLAAAAARLAAFNDLTSELFARVTLARVRLERLDPGGALVDEPRMAELAQREPSDERRHYLELLRAEVLAANGRMRQASSLLVAVREGAGTAGDVVMLGAAQAVAAQWALKADPALAALEAQAALNAPWEDEGPRDFARTWRVLICARLALGDIEAARGSLSAFEAWAARKGDPALDAVLWLARAEVAAAVGEPARAALAYETALAAAEATRIPAELLQVCSSYSSWLLTRGDATRAMALLGRVAAWAERDYDTALLAARLHKTLGHEAAWQALAAHAARLAGERVPPPDLVAQPADAAQIKD